MHRRSVFFASFLVMFGGVAACATAVDDTGTVPRSDAQSFPDAGNEDVPVDQDNDSSPFLDDTGSPFVDDTGSATNADTGSTSDDTGTTSDDTGTAPTDTGTTPTDTGTTPTDTGTTPTDTGPSCSQSPCSLFPQCGCSASQACNIKDATGATQCATAGTGGQGTACTEGSTGTCKKGFECVFGICQQLCGTTSDCPSNDNCANIQSSSGPIPGFDICAQNCKLSSPAGVCGTGNCSLVTSTETVCTAAGSTGQNGDCTSNPYACKPGFLCLQETGPTDYECLKVCTNVGGTCSGGLTCYGLSPALTIGGTTYGVCDT